VIAPIRASKDKTYASFSYSYQYHIHIVRQVTDFVDNLLLLLVSEIFNFSLNCKVPMPPRVIQPFDLSFHEDGLRPRQPLGEWLGQPITRQQETVILLYPVKSIPVRTE
jgi:hypothetical protein